MTSLRATAKLLETIGDFEAQMVITELLVRLASNPHLTPNFFGDGHDVHFMMFTAITKDNFEVEARNFINYVNQQLGDEAQVWTVGCFSAKVIQVSFIYSILNEF